MSLRRFTASAFVLVALLLVDGRIVAAAPIPGIASLQDLINQNQGNPDDGVPQGGVTISGIRFYDFSYTPSGTGAPTAAEVSVQTTDGPTASTGLEFESNWLAAGGNDLLSTIRYKVQAPAGQRFSSAGLFFNGRVPPGLTGADTFAEAAETLNTLASDEIGQLLVRNDGGDPANDALAGRLATSGNIASMRVTTVIRAHSDPTGLSLISVVDNTFAVAPAMTANVARGALSGSAIAVASLLLAGRALRRR